MMSLIEFGWLPALAAAYHSQMTVNAAQKLTALKLRPSEAVLVP